METLAQAQEQEQTRRILKQTRSDPSKHNILLKMVLLCIRMEQKDLAKIIGCHPSLIARIANGFSSASRPISEKIYAVVKEKMGDQAPSIQALFPKRNV